MESMFTNPYKPPGTAAYGYPVYPSYPSYPGAVPPSYPGGAPMTPPVGTAPAAQGPGVNVPGQLPLEESYIENILRLNLGKMATIYMTFENNTQWNAKVFRGKLEAAGRDHIIISDPQTGMRTLLLMVNLDYITFDEPLNYYYPYTTGGTPVSSGR
jgi:spore germination protein Q